MVPAASAVGTVVELYSALPLNFSCGCPATGWLRPPALRIHRPVSIFWSTSTLNDLNSANAVRPDAASRVVGRVSVPPRPHDTCEASKMTGAVGYAAVAAAVAVV